VIGSAFPLVRVVVRGRVELPTFRFSGAILQSRNVADRGPTCHLAASTVAHRRLASVTACLRWLPIWLPAIGDPAVIGYIYLALQLGRRTVGPARQLSPMPGPTRLQRGLRPAQQRHLQLCHDLPPCLAHAAVPLMMNRHELPGCAVLSSQRIGTGEEAGSVGLSLTEREAPTRTTREISALPASACGPQGFDFGVSLSWSPRSGDA
jgi:hypothetical protein